MCLIFTKLLKYKENCFKMGFKTLDLWVKGVGSIDSVYTAVY